MWGWPLAGVRPPLALLSLGAELLAGVRPPLALLSLGAELLAGVRPLPVVGTGVHETQQGYRVARGACEQSYY